MYVSGIKILAIAIALLYIDKLPSLEMIKVHHYIGNGSFGTVYKVSIEGKLYALKKVPLWII